MSTRQFDPSAAPTVQLVLPQRISVFAEAKPEAASRGRLPHVAPGIGGLPPQAQAAMLSRSSGGRLARAGDVLLQLQRLRGNRHVQRVLDHTRGHTEPTPRPVTAPVIQTKLVLGRSDDRYEQEADHVAETVVRSLRSQPDAVGKPQLAKAESVVSRKASSSADPLGGTSIDVGNEQTIAGVRGGGVALAPAVRSRMEAVFGSDFGAVRIHQGPAADTLSRRLQARAFTSGSDIFFASGGYQPVSSSGQALLAHELTHVVQQGAAGPIRSGPDRPAAGEASAPVTLRRSGQAVQRAILAIDGAADNADALKATRNCLANLTSNKQLPTSLGKLIRQYSAGDARGRVYGPDGKVSALAGLTAGISAISPLETLYFLGHGTTANIAGLTPSELATALVTAFAGYPDTFIGALKIVACYSASTLQFGGSSMGGHGATVAKSYADQVNSQLDTKNDAKFRPRFVEGIRGIAWVDEETGQRVGYDVGGERPGHLTPLERVYTQPPLLATWFKALTHADPVLRKAEMDVILEAMHKTRGLPSTTERRVTGKAARERYLSGSARNDFGVAAKLLRSTAKSDKPNLVLAMTALKRMMLDWQTMDTAERKAMLTEAIRAHGAFQIVFEGRIPSPREINEMWVI